MSEEVFDTDDIETMVMACDEMEEDSCTVSDAQSLVSGMSQAKIHRLKLIMAWIRMHPG